MTDQTLSASGATASGTSGPAAYRVLARKYRPSDFTTLIGQDALVRTLSNALQSGRLAQAYVLTGVRGVGKTTTARIIARALNCIGPDGQGGPTIQPCGVCESCRAIAEDRHVDVIEMDAASRTGVNDMREILDGVRYRPTSARYKVYIIDEVHMLSTAAFNALLKTLEEPPEHVKFIFATTEIRKVPVTVLSRCQRFDLRRVGADLLAGHFRRIVETEGAAVEDAALALLARAADGSVRDGLSLLDQAIAHAGAVGGGGTVTEAQVREMLGLADRGQVFDLFDALMRGDIASALAVLADQHAAGADPVVVLNDLLDLTHWLTRLKATPQAAEDPMLGEAERVRGREMAEKLSMAVLTRTWQMLLKAVAEARMAGNPMQATEMALIRLTYAADLPTPADVVAKAPPRGPVGSAPSGGGMPPGPSGAVSAPPAGEGVPRSRPSPGPLNSPASAPQPQAARPAVSAPPSPQSGPAMVPPWEDMPSALPAYDGPPEPPPHDGGGLPPGPAAAGGASAPVSFDRLVAMFKSRREAVLSVHLERDVHLVRYEPGRLEYRPTPQAPQDLAARVAKCLNLWTGQRWAVLTSTAVGDPTLFEQTMTGAKAHPLVQAALRAFPSASIGTIRDLEPSDDLPGSSGAFVPVMVPDAAGFGGDFTDDAAEFGGEFD